MTETLAAAVTVTVPTPRVNGVGSGVTLAAPLIVSDPKPKVNGLPDGVIKLLLVQKNFQLKELMHYQLH